MPRRFSINAGKQIRSNMVITSKFLIFKESLLLCLSVTVSMNKTRYIRVRPYTLKARGYLEPSSYRLVTSAIVYCIHQKGSGCMKFYEFYQKNLNKKFTSKCTFTS